MSFLAILLSLIQLATPASASKPIERLCAKTPVTGLSAIDAAHIAGIFKNPGKSLIKRIGGALSGETLYLFRDGTYIYSEWADISADTVYDKGAWTYSGGLVQLVSDPEVKWKPEIDRQLVAFRRASVPDEILLIEITQRLADFEKQAGDDPELTLLYIAKERFKKLQASDSSKLKARLMKDCWNPHYHIQP
jgi:hypothetical protein